MERQKLLWHYYCLFKQNSDFIEEYSFIFIGKEHSRQRLSSKGWDFIHSSVHQAVHFYSTTDLTSEELKHVVLNGMSNPWRKWRQFNYWGRRNHRRTNHYVRQKHHVKKEISESQLAKNDWIKLKGIDKDKKKNGWRRGGAGKYYKRLSNHMHRSWEKEKIFHEEYDAMHNVDYKYFLDPWMWD